MTLGRPRSTVVSISYNSLLGLYTSKMRWGSLVTVLASLTASAASYSIGHLPKRDLGVEVVLSSAGNTEVKAVVTNRGSSKVSLLNFNSVLDPAPVQKVSVQKNGMFN